MGNKREMNKKNTMKNSYSQRKLKLLKTQKPTIGIDIGTSSVKIVQMKKNSKLKQWGIEAIPEGMVVQGRIQASAPLSEIIHRAMKHNKISGSVCNLCLSSTELIVRELRLPEMDEKQIFDNIKHEITSFLPLDHDEYCIDYKVLEYIKPEDEKTLGKLRVMVAAIPKSVVLSYIKTLKKAKLKVACVDVIPNSVGKISKWIMQNSIESNDRKNTCIIDFGANSTQIIILKGGNYFIHKTLQNGGDHLTALIAERMDLDLMDAEEMKLKSNFFNNSIELFLSQEVKSYYDYLITDIERTIDFFKNRNHQSVIDQIYIMGGGSMLQGLDEYMRSQLSLEVTHISFALRNLFGENDLGNNYSFFSHAIGVTMREEW